MLEIDFETEQGRKEAKEKILEVVSKDDKKELSELLFSMLDFIVQHEVKLNNIKNVL